MAYIDCEITINNIPKMDKPAFVAMVNGWAEVTRISFGGVGKFDPTLERMFRDLESQYMKIAEYCRSRLEDSEGSK